MPDLSQADRGKPDIAMRHPTGSGRRPGPGPQQLSPCPLRCGRGGEEGGEAEDVPEPRSRPASGKPASLGSAPGTLFSYKGRFLAGSGRGVGEPALTRWLGLWIINYGCAGTWGPSRRPRGRAFRGRPAFPSGPPARQPPRKGTESQVRSGPVRVEAAAASFSVRPSLRFLVKPQKQPFGLRA